MNDLTTLEKGIAEAEEYISRGRSHDHAPTGATPGQDHSDFEFRVKALRRRLGLSQAQFAERYGLPIGTVRNWEQGRRARSDAAGGLLLTLIERDPDGVAAVARAEEGLEHSN